MWERLVDFEISDLGQILKDVWMVSQNGIEQNLQRMIFLLASYLLPFTIISVSDGEHCKDEEKAHMQPRQKPFFGCWQKSVTIFVVEFELICLMFLIA